jgi:glucan phosphoethanolaminetransferase (alkaline phosphatase superfamily)
MRRQPLLAWMPILMTTRTAAETLLPALTPQLLRLSKLLGLFVLFSVIAVFHYLLLYKASSDFKKRTKNDADNYIRIKMLMETCALNRYKQQREQGAKDGETTNSRRESKCVFIKAEWCLCLLPQGIVSDI